MIKKVRFLIIILLLPLLFTSCPIFNWGEEVTIMEELYLPESGTLQVGEEIELSLCVNYSKEKENRILLFILENESISGPTTNDLFEITIINGEAISIDNDQEYDEYEQEFYLQSSEGSYLWHIFLSPKIPGDYIISICLFIDHPYDPGYFKDLQFTVTE